MKVENAQLYQGLNVVWVRGDFVTYHRADLRDGFYPGESKTLCGALVLLFLIKSRTIEADLKEGSHNCQGCFKNYAKQTKTK